MTEGESPSAPAQAAGSQRLAILLSMAMFVLVACAVVCFNRL